MLSATGDKCSAERMQRGWRAAEARHRCDSLFPRRSLAIVTTFAQRLPVVTLPKQHLVSAMRPNVIDDSRGNSFACAQAARAQRMLAEKPCAGLSPTSIVTTAGGRGAVGCGQAFCESTIRHAILVTRWASCRVRGWPCAKLWRVVPALLRQAACRVLPAQSLRIARASLPTRL